MPQTNISVGTAWKRGIPAEAPDCEDARTRLYAPTDALLLRDGARVVTVLYVDYERLSAPDLIWCEDCGCATTLAGSPTVCEWCETSLDARRSDGQLHVSRATAAAGN